MSSAATARRLDPNLSNVPRLRPERVDVTAKQAHDWTITRTAFLSTCPAFAHVLYTMMNPGQHKDIAYFTKDVPIAATDDRYLFLNPDKFFEYSLPERVFIVGHEVLHAIMGHASSSYAISKRGKISYMDGKSLPYDHKIMNYALDYVVNAILVESKVGKLPTGALHDTKIATHMDDALTTYRKIYEKCDGDSGKLGGNRFDEHLAPGEGDGQDAEDGAAARAASDIEWKTAVAQAMASAKAQGKLPACLDRMFNEVLDPTVSWEEHIAALFARKVGSGGYDYRRPDRRLVVRDIYAPGRSGHGAGTIVVGGDTSGSITPPVLDRFFAELAGILEDLRPKRLIIMWCDSKVHRVDEADDAADLNVIRYKGAPGGGGTSFVPVFDEIDDLGLEPDALVYLTDGDGTFPGRAPTYPVIWGNISRPGRINYPFGDVVHVTL